MLGLGVRVRIVLGLGVECDLFKTNSIQDKLKKNLTQMYLTQTPDPNPEASRPDPPFVPCTT